MYSPYEMWQNSHSKTARHSANAGMWRGGKGWILSEYLKEVTNDVDSAIVVKMTMICGDAKKKATTTAKRNEELERENIIRLQKLKCIWYICTNAEIIEYVFHKRLNTSIKCKKWHAIFKLTYRNADAYNRIESQKMKWNSAEWVCQSMCERKTEKMIAGGLSQKEG